MLTQALNILQRFECKVNVPQQEARDWTDTVNEILELWAQIEHYQGNITQRGVQIRQWEPWGDFDPKDIEALFAWGIYARLCEVPAGKETVVPKGVILEKIHLASGTYKCLAICREKSRASLGDDHAACFGSWSDEKNADRGSGQDSAGRGRIIELRCYCGAFRKILVDRENVLSFEEVEKGMRAEQELALLKDIVPRRLWSHRGQGEAGTMGGFIRRPFRRRQCPDALAQPALGGDDRLFLASSMFFPDIARWTSAPYF